MIEEVDLVEIEFDLSQKRTRIRAISQSGDESFDTSNELVNQSIDFKVTLLSANNTKLLALTKLPIASVTLCVDDTKEANQARCFTGLACYSGTQVIASLALQRPTLFSQSINPSNTQCNVLELGCGIGLAGAAIVGRAFAQCTDSARSRPYLLMTDGEEEAVKLSTKNIQWSLNQLIESSDHPSDHSNVSVIQALWSDEGRQKVSDHMRQVTPNHPSVSRSIKFDLIYGTDLLYAKTSLRAIVDFSFPMLDKYGMLLLAHAPRSDGLHEQLQSINQSVYQSVLSDDPTNEQPVKPSISQWSEQLQMFYIKLNSFLDDDTITEFQWFGIDVCVICRFFDYPVIELSLQQLGLVIQSVSDIERAIAELNDEEGGLMDLDMGD